MELLVPHECHSCGSVDEAKFTYAGPHIKQVCNGCGRYVKFFSKNCIPDVMEIKFKIWYIVKDTAKIELIKARIGFQDDLSGLDEKMMYWRLYLSVRKGMEVEV